MFSLLAHHAEAFFKVEINGRDYPDGMTEHAIFYAITIAVLALMSYGTYAGVRDYFRWKRGPVTVKS
jgi:hypothetical protein